MWIIVTVQLPALFYPHTQFKTSKKTQSSFSYFLYFIFPLFAVRLCVYFPFVKVFTLLFLVFILWQLSGAANVDCPTTRWLFLPSAFRGWQTVVASLLWQQEKVDNNVG
jgi:hypothetical protein